MSLRSYTARAVTRGMVQVETRVLIIDRNAGFPALLRSMQPQLRVTSVQSGGGAATALSASGASVAVVDLEAPGAGTALAVLMRSKVPTILVSEEEAETSPRVQSLMARFGVARFIQRPFPILDFGEVVLQVASAPPPPPAEEEGPPLAPWDIDPSGWSEEDEAPSSAPVVQPAQPPAPQSRDEPYSGPVPPWEDNPSAWDGKPARAPAVEAHRPARYAHASQEPSSRPAVPTKSQSLVPPWEREPDRWTGMERPVAPWEEKPTAWKQEQRLAHSDLDRINVKVLRQLMNLWLRHRNGTLSADEVRGTAAFTDGAPSDTASDAVTRELLQTAHARLHFEEGSRRPNHAREAFGAKLFGAALDVSKKDWVEANAEMAMQPVQFLSELSDLPIGNQTLRVLETADGVLRLLDHLSALKVRLPDVEAHLAALAKLRLIELVDTSVDLDKRRARKSWVRSAAYEGSDRRNEERRGGPERRRNRDRRRDRRRAGAVADAGEDRRDGDRRSEDRRTGQDRRTGEAPKDRKARRRVRPALGQDVHLPADIEKLLDREWKLIGQAEAWSVLGLPPTETREVVLATGQRMLGRYEAVEGDASLMPEVRAKARQVCERIRWAMRTARPTVGKGPARTTQDQTVFSEGMKAMLVRDWGTAVNCFRTAHKMAVEEARYMGYYGWALWKRSEGQTGAAQAKARKDAEDLLRLCDTIDSGLVPCQLFLAQVELEVGDLRRSKARLERLRARGDEPPGVDLLWVAIQKA